jgi:hypothetical protein
MLEPHKWLTIPSTIICDKCGRSIPEHSRICWIAPKEMLLCDTCGEQWIFDNEIIHGSEAKTACEAARRAIEAQRALEDM